MKLFGEYLIEQKLITEDQLAATLIEQMRSLPTLAEVIFDSKLMNTSEIVRVLAFQAKRQLDFKAAAVKLNLWNQDLELKTQKIISEKRVPLGQLLYANKMLTIQDLTKAFDEFISVQANNRLSFQRESDKPALGNFEKMKIKFFITLFDEKQKNYSETFLKDKTAFDKIRISHELNILRGAARIANLEVCESLLIGLFSYIDKFEQIILSEESLQTCSVFLSLLREVRDILSETFSEQTFLTKIENQTRMNELFKISNSPMISVGLQAS